MNQPITGHQQVLKFYDSWLSFQGPGEQRDGLRALLSLIQDIPLRELGRLSLQYSQPTEIYPDIPSTEGN